MEEVKSFRWAQTLLACIELLQMIRKGQYQHPAGACLSPAEQFYLLAAVKNGNATFADLPTVMRQSPPWRVLTIQERGFRSQVFPATRHPAPENTISSSLVS